MVAGITIAEPDDRSVSSTSNNILPSVRHRAIELSRIIGLWDSRYIVVSHPFLTCMMLPPYAVDAESLRTQPLVVTANDLAKLVLGHFGEKWKLGCVVSGKVMCHIYLLKLNIFRSRKDFRAARVPQCRRETACKTLCSFFPHAAAQFE